MYHHVNPPSKLNFQDVILQLISSKISSSPNYLVCLFEFIVWTHSRECKRFCPEDVGESSSGEEETFESEVGRPNKTKKCQSVQRSGCNNNTDKVPSPPAQLLRHKRPANCIVKSGHAPGRNYGSIRLFICVAFGLLVHMCDELGIGKFVLFSFAYWTINMLVLMPYSDIDNQSQVLLHMNYAAVNIQVTEKIPVEAISLKKSLKFIFQSCFENLCYLWQ